VTAALKYQNFISKLTLIVSALLKNVSIHRIIRLQNWMGYNFFQDKDYFLKWLVPAQSVTVNIISLS
jgi:hypothetical protein